jgi:hypothetical protein
MRNTTNPQTSNQNTQKLTSRDSQDGHVLRIICKIKQIILFYDLPPWRGRLRSSSSCFQDCPQSCRCLNCQSIRSERQLRFKNNFPTLQQLLSRKLIPRQKKPCSPDADNHDQFCTRYPHCIHGMIHRSRLNKTLYMENFEPSRNYNRTPELKRREIPYPRQSTVRKE